MDEIIKELDKYRQDLRDSLKASANTYSASNKIYTGDEMMAFAIHCGAAHASKADIEAWEAAYFPVMVEVAKGQFVEVKGRPDAVFEAKKHLAQVASGLTSYYGYNVAWEDDGKPPFFVRADAPPTGRGFKIGDPLGDIIDISLLNK